MGKIISPHKGFKVKNVIEEKLVSIHTLGPTGGD